MAAARDELPDFNSLAAFGLEEFRDEEDAMNAEKTKLVVSRATRKEDLRTWKITTSTISSQIRRQNELKNQRNGRSHFLQVSWNSTSLF